MLCFLPLLLFSLLFISPVYGGGTTCTTTADCTGGKICVINKCGACKTHLECSTELPSLPFCYGGFCVECDKDYQCPSPSLSHCAHKVCSPCTGNNHCQHISGSKGYCYNGACVECYSNTHCTAGTCNMALNLCQGPTCTVGGGQCSSTSTLPVCSGGNCRSCGANSTFCSSTFTNYLCTADGSCKQCWLDTDCPLANASECLATKVCGTCTGDPQCSHISGKNKCLNGVGCVECTSPVDCSPGSTCNSNVCVASLTPLKITLYDTHQPDIYVIEFPIELVTNTIVEQGISIELVGIDPAIYTYTLVKLTDTQYQIQFKVTQTIPSTTLHLQFTYLSTVEANPMPSFYDSEIPSKRIPYINEQQKQFSETMQLIGEIATVGMAAASGSILILGGNPAIMWALISLIQAFYYLIFVNVNYPANVQLFLKIFTLAGFGFIPNPMEWFSPDIKQQTLPTPARFEEYDVNGLFLDNAGNMMLIWALVFLLYGVSFILNKFLNRMSRLIPIVFGKIVGWFEWSGVLRAIITSYAEIIQAAFLQMRVVTFDSKLLGVSSIFGIIFSAFGFAFPLLTFLLIRKFSKNQRMLRKFSALVDDYSTKGNFPKYFGTIMLLKMLFIMLTLVFLHDYPYLEIFILIGISVILVALQIKFQPYQTKVDNHLNIICEVLFVIIQILIAVLIHDDHILEYSEDTRLDIGWALIAICGVIVLINVGKTLIEQIKALVQLWKLIKKVFQKEIKKKKIGPKSFNEPRSRGSSILDNSILTQDSSMYGSKIVAKSPQRKQGRIRQRKTNNYSDI